MKKPPEIASEALRAIVRFYRPRGEDEDASNPNQKVWPGLWIWNKFAALAGGVPSYLAFKRILVSHDLLACLMSAVIAAPLAIGRARRILITDEAVTFWGWFVGPRRYNFSEIASISRGERASGVTPRTIHIMLKGAVLPVDIPVEGADSEAVLESMVSALRRYLGEQASPSPAERRPSKPVPPR